MRNPACWFLICLTTAAVATVSCRTAPPSRAAGTPVRVALISDLHVMRGTNAEQKLYPLRLAKTIEGVNAAGVDFVVAAGDLTEHGTPSEFREFRRQMLKFKPPVFWVPGNHDLGNKKIPGKKESINFGRLRNYELECGRSYFCRECAGVRVIGVNSALLASRLPQEAGMWNLLEQELAIPSRKPTLLVLHHPPFLKTSDEPGGEYFNLEPYPRARLLALAKQGGVNATLSGHLHRGLTNYVNGMVLLTTPPVSFGLEQKKPNQGWTLVTMQGTNVTWDYHPLPKVTLPSAPGRKAPAPPFQAVTPVNPAKWQQ